MKANSLKRSLIVVLSSLLMVMVGLVVGLTGAFSVKAESYEPEKGQFYMLDGAQVSQLDGYAMRFTTKISEEYYNELDALGEVSFFTTIGPLGFTPNTDYYTSALVFEDGYADIYGVITYSNIPESELKENAAVELTGKAYAKVILDETGEELIIAATRNDTTRSMRAVANLELLEGNHPEGSNARKTLEKYLGNVIREEGVQNLTNRDTVVRFENLVTGRVFINGVRTNLFVENTREVDIKGYISWDRVDVSKTFTVSVFGDNGTSLYDVVSKDVDYELEVIYEDENGNATTDYKILCTGSGHTYVPARHLIEILEVGTGSTQKILDGEMTRFIHSYDKASEYNKATLDGNYIVIGTNNDMFKRANLEYNKKEFANGDYVVAVKGNCIFLYGGDETSSGSAAYGNDYAVHELMNKFFGFEVTGIVPTPIKDALPAIKTGATSSWAYSLDDLVYSINEDVTNVTIKSGSFERYSPDIANRGGSYGTSDTDLVRMVKTNGNQSETIMSAYGVTYEDYIKIVDAGAMEKKAWYCNYTDKDGKAAGHYIYSATKPEACSNTNCVSREGVDFTDVTKTLEAYNRCYTYYCMTCAHTTVSFGTPTKCLANYNQAIHGKPASTCAGRVFSSITNARWHTAGHAFPVMNNIDTHPDWFGDDAIFACSECKKTYNYTYCYDMTTGEPLKTLQICGSCHTGYITKYYGSASDYYGCDREDCGIVSDENHEGQECECGDGIIVFYDSSTEPNIFGKVRTGTDRVPNKMQPCFTAHGNEAEYKLMVIEGAKKILNNIKYVDLNNLAREVFAFSDIDGTSHCECDECIKYYIKYKTMASTQIRFCNDVSKFVEAWMIRTGTINPATFSEEFKKDIGEKGATGEDYIKWWTGEANVEDWWTVYNAETDKYEPIESMSAYRRSIVVHFFAYHGGKDTNTNGDRQAPVVYNESKGKYVPIDSVVEMYQGKYCSTGVYLVTSADAVREIPKTDENGNYLDANGNITTDLSKVAFYSYDEIYNGEFKYVYANDVIFKYTSDYDSSAVRKHMTEWSNLSGGTKMYLWVNTQSSNFTTVPYYSANLVDPDFFTFMGSTSVDTLFLYASSAEGNAVTAFNNLKLYVNVERLWDNEADLETLYDTWFDATFVDEQIIAKMKEAFVFEMNMAVKANYLQAHSAEHVDYDEENTSFLGNSQSYTSIMGPMGEYWNVDDLIKLYNMFVAADARLNELMVAEGLIDENGNELDSTGKDMIKLKYTKIRGMLYSEWYAPLVTIMRYYQNDAKIIPLRAEMDSKFKEIIDYTGIKYNAEYAAPTAPTSDMIYYTTQLEVVIFDFTEYGGSDASAAKLPNSLDYMLYKNEANGNIYKDFNGDKNYTEDEIVYNYELGELNLRVGERYRVLLRTTQDLFDRDNKLMYPKGTYIVGNSAYFGHDMFDGVKDNRLVVDTGFCGRYTSGWPTYYSVSKASAIISTTSLDIDGKQVMSDFVSTKAAFMTKDEREQFHAEYPGFDGAKDTHEVETRYIAGANRKVAVHCDEINILVGMGVTNWGGESVFTIQVNIVEN